MSIMLLKAAAVLMSSLLEELIWTVLIHSLLFRWREVRLSKKYDSDRVLMDFLIYFFFMESKKLILTFVIKAQLVKVPLLLTLA